MSFVAPSNHCRCVWRCRVVMLLLWSRFCKSWERGREGGEGERGGPEEPAVTRTPAPCLHSWKPVSDTACNTDWIMCITLPPSVLSLLPSSSPPLSPPPHFTSVRWPDYWWLTEQTSTSMVVVTVGLLSFMQPWLVSWIVAFS